MSTTTYRCGADPEFFLLQEGKPKAICGMLNHDKWNPMQYEDMPEGFQVSEDNVAVEFGFPPANSAKEFVKNLQAVKRRFLKDHPNFKYSKSSALVFPENELQHPMAKVFGCEPDFNAWTKQPNPKPAAKNPALRSAGGHVHVETKEDPFAVGRMLDLYLGVPSVLMDKGTLRRQLYGKHGAMRVKPYGMEYRVLSNFWCEKEKHITWVWNNVGKALEQVAAGVDIKHLHQLIEQAIDTNDSSLAQHLVDEYNLEVV